MAYAEDAAAARRVLGLNANGGIPLDKRHPNVFINHRNYELGGTPLPGLPRCPHKMYGSAEMIDPSRDDVRLVRDWIDQSYGHHAYVEEKKPNPLGGVYCVCGNPDSAPVHRECKGLQ